MNQAFKIKKKEKVDLSILFFIDDSCTIIDSRILELFRMISPDLWKKKSTPNISASFQNIIQIIPKFVLVVEDKCDSYQISIV